MGNGYKEQVICVHNRCKEGIKEGLNKDTDDITMKEEEGKQEDDDDKKPVKMEEGEGGETVKNEEKEEDKDKDRLEESLYDEELIEGFSFCSFDTFKGPVGGFAFRPPGLTMV